MIMNYFIFNKRFPEIPHKRHPQPANMHCHLYVFIMNIIKQEGYTNNAIKCELSQKLLFFYQKNVYGILSLICIYMQERL